MTDRIHSITVALDHNIRVDDAESLIEAFRHFKGVVAVDGNVSRMDQFVAEQRVRHELGSALLAVLYPERKP